MNIKKQVVVFAGPSGSGKTSIANALLAIGKTPAFVRFFASNGQGKNYGLGGVFYAPPSCTTRPRRDGETNAALGKDGAFHGAYHFMTTQEFLEKQQKGEFLEISNPQKGVYYGTLKSDIDLALSTNKITLLVRDPEGAVRVGKHIEKTDPDAIVTQSYIDTPKETSFFRRLADLRGDPSYVSQRIFYMLNEEPSYAPEMDLPGGMKYKADLVIPNGPGISKEAFLHNGIELVTQTMVKNLGLHVNNEKRLSIENDVQNSRKNNSLLGLQ